MSSIYRKGRDGYYYYQTYVYNPETGKKDKRIFHSLSTKDQFEAEEKQIQFDKQYENQVQDQMTHPGISFISQNKKTIATIFATAIITLIVMDLSELKIKENKKKRVLPVTENIKIEKYPPVSEVNLGVDKDQEKIEKVEKEKPKPEIQKSIPKQEKPKSAIPKHTVVRMDRLSGAFEQGKVYVTVDNSPNNESLKLLCKKLKKDYSEFSNIVICLYANNRIGKEMANGSTPNVSTEIQQRSWLAMYTYNSVEGEYFDNNPGGYLGAY